jgi:3-hydroxyisobutyrate dehydrogenase-like beta-hydroxyacid dehydrogenase
MAARVTTIGVIGLGRMGSQMATNLFAKRFAERTATSATSRPAFLVCDAVASASHSFVADFEKQFPGVNLRVCSSPAE